MTTDAHIIAAYRTMSEAFDQSTFALRVVAVAAILQVEARRVQLVMIDYENCQGAG